MTVGATTDNRAAVRTAVTSPTTIESDFQTNIGLMVDQVDKSVNAVTLTGDVTGTATLDPDTNDNHLMIATTIQGQSIAAGDIESTSKVRFRILDAAGGVLFQMDGLTP